MRLSFRLALKFAAGAITRGSRGRIVHGHDKVNVTTPTAVHDRRFDSRIDVRVTIFQPSCTTFAASY
jgi:hypothetical protein